MQWRLLVDPPGSAARNMAVDEALYVSARRSEQATVRLYGFDPPTVSLGYRQVLANAVDEEACRDNGVDLVRRITGGWALLHQNELTWSVAAPTRAGVFRTRSVRDAYRLVNGVIRRACEELGLRLDPEPERDPGPPRPPRELEPGLPCLAAPSPHEITVSGRKLAPSAQRRHRDSLLQHGSILFAVDRALWDRIRPKGFSAHLNAVGLAELLPAPISRDFLVEKLRWAFGAFFGEDAYASGLEPREMASIQTLVRKYASRSHLLSARYIDNSEAVW